MGKFGWTRSRASARIPCASHRIDVMHPLRYDSRGEEGRGACEQDVGEEAACGLGWARRWSSSGGSPAYLGDPQRIWGSFSTQLFSTQLFSTQLFSTQLFSTQLLATQVS